MLPLASGAASATDAELVARGVAGERFALQLLYRRHVGPVAARVTRLLSRSAEAEDVVQDAFLTAFRELDRLAEPARFAPWLQSIAVRQAHRRFRRRRLLARLGLDRGVDDALLALVADPAAGPEVRTELARIDRQLAALPADERMAWMLRHVEGCALEELAEHCGCSLATAKRRIRRAEAAIEAGLTERAGEAAGGERG